MSKKIYIIKDKGKGPLTTVPAASLVNLNAWCGGGSGQPTEYVIEVTKEELDTLISTSTLVSGALYKITGVQPSLYGGTTIFIRAVSNDTLSLDGTGIFYNPKYDQLKAGFNVWDETKSYSVGEIVHWGGKTWSNKTGVVGTSNSIFELDSINWDLIPFNDVDYNEVFDSIKYVYNEDLIIERNEKNSNKVSFTVIFSKQNPEINPIKYFMWGNSIDNLIIYYYDEFRMSGISNVVVNNSIFENINFKGEIQRNILFENFSKQVNCTYDYHSKQESLFFNESVQDNIILGRGSSQEDLIFNNSYQLNITLNSSSQSEFRFDRSYQENISLIYSHQFNLKFTKSYQAKIDFGQNCRQQNLKFTKSYQANIDFGNSTQENLEFTESSQSNIIFKTSTQEDIYLKYSNQTNLTLFGNTNIQKMLKFENYSSNRGGDTIQTLEENFKFSNVLITKPMLVAELNSIIQTNKSIGLRCIVKDALTPIYLNVVVGGGTTICWVTWNGDNWIIQ